MATERQRLVTDGLGLSSVLVTEGIMPAIAALILTYLNQSFDEPPIIAYVTLKVQASLNQRKGAMIIIEVSPD